MAEAVLVAASSAVILMILIYAVPDCQPIRGHHPPSNHTPGSMIHNNSHLPIDTHEAVLKRSVDGLVSDNGGSYGNENDSSHMSDYHNDHHDLYGLHGDHGYVFQVFFSHIGLTLSDRNGD